MLRLVGENWSSGVDLGDALRAVENAAPVDAVAAVTRGFGADLGAVWVSFPVADMSGRALVRLAHEPIGDLPGRRRQDEDVATVLPFDGGPQEQAVRSQRLLVRASGDEFVVMAPVTHRGDAIGLLELSLPVEPDHAALAQVSRAAHVLAFVVIATRRHTDLFEWGQRTTPFTLAAEIQRRLLPAAFTCEADSFTLSAWLEPAASIGDGHCHCRSTRPSASWATRPTVPPILRYAPATVSSYSPTECWSAVPPLWTCPRNCHA
jgi:hypothetical protein